MVYTDDLRASAFPAQTCPAARKRSRKKEDGAARFVEKRLEDCIVESRSGRSPLFFNYRPYTEHYSWKGVVIDVAHEPPGQLLSLVQGPLTAKAGHGRRGSFRTLGEYGCSAA